PIELLPGRSFLDHQLVDGLVRPSGWSWCQTRDAVRASLIHVDGSREDLDQAFANSERTHRAIEQLSRNVMTRTPSQFDRYVKNIRERQCLGLVGATRHKGWEREEAALAGEAIHEALLWTAYDRLARCYGLLMLLALVGLGKNISPPLSAEELWLFRQRH